MTSKEFTRSHFSGVFLEPRELVDSALNGFVEVNKGLVLLEGYKIILRRNYRLLNQVKLLSGGWSGFDPLYTGYVGPAMLTGAVVGDHYSTPPVSSILVAIRELSMGNTFGVLLIIMNKYLFKVNFLLAVEKAKRENIFVEVLFVGDDCSGNVGKEGRKGLAGITMIIKIAGAMAEEKRTLEEIYNTCSEICIATISVNVHSARNTNEVARGKSTEDMCSIGGDSSCMYNSIDSDTKAIKVRDDLGEGAGSSKSRGIHQFFTALELARTLLGYTVDGSLSQYAVLQDDNEPIAILMNNYGFVLDLELFALVHEVCCELKRRNINLNRIYIGTFLGSRNVGGFSMTAIKVSPELVHYLDYPVMVPGWSKIVQRNYESPTPLSKRVRGRSHVDDEPKRSGPILNYKATEQVRRVLEFVCMALVSCEVQVNKMETERLQSVCTGFYGSQIKTAVEIITDDLYNNVLILNCPHALFSQLSKICSNYLHNPTGCFYVVFFEGISQWFLRYFNETETEASMWTNALANGIKTMEDYFGIKRGDRNMLDSLYPMLEVMKDSPNAYGQIAEAAELGSLRSLDPDLKSHSMPEPATYVVTLWARAAAEALKTCNATSNEEFESISEESDISSIESISD